MRRGNFKGRGRPNVKYTGTLRSAETAEPIEMPMGYGLGWVQGIMCKMGVQTPDRPIGWGNYWGKGRPM